MTTPSRPDAARNASPFLFGGEAEAVAGALLSGQYGHTDVTETFEKGVAAFLGVPETVAVTTGTAALHIALVAAGVGPGCEVVVPSLTFCATIQAILACGANPRFVDVNPDTLCVEPEEILGALTRATTAVMPVLFGGRAIDLSGIADTLQERGIAVIEDAAHAFGSFDGDVRVGATGALTCFSFGPIKNLTCGQGGMIVPRNAQEAQLARSLRGLGIVESQARRAVTTSYSVERFGFRQQLSSINAAIGNVQLANFDRAQAGRKKLWRAYRAALAGLSSVKLVDVDVDNSVPHLCVVRVPYRDAVFEEMRARGIGVGVHYPPNHQQRAFSSWHRKLPVTERIAGEIMSLPFHPHMSEDEAVSVVEALKESLAVAGTQR
ncbi:DegT/DnrJ/EryC1/StrS family aminotransferase [Kitasatospora sp. NPDC088548]|uniref:DegT/DnrJ/EryC1/StrS family aminotransferase n=1 Tax=Kitasatospora sp. NPDC088548 TaxID=3364075 RepID=UPI003826584E